MHKVRSTELNQMQAWRDSITTTLRDLACVQVPSGAAVTSFCGLVSLHLPSHLGLGSPGHLPVSEILCGSLYFSACWSTCREPVPPVLLHFSLRASASLTLAHASELGSNCFFLWGASQHPALHSTCPNIYLDIGCGIVLLLTTYTPLHI